MRIVRALTATTILTVATAATAPAQTITLIDDSGPRASIKVGYGGHGLDWETSIDSRAFADRLRFRAGLGQGRWSTEYDSYEDPTVTRLAASALAFIRTRNDLKPYVGLGFSAYVPRGVDIPRQTGARFILGAEGSGDGWTVGGEVELDLPHDRPSVDRLPVSRRLFFTGRIGIAVRRHF